MPGSDISVREDSDLNVRNRDRLCDLPYDSPNSLCQNCQEGFCHNGRCLILVKCSLAPPGAFLD